MSHQQTNFALSIRVCDQFILANGQMDVGGGGYEGEKYSEALWLRPINSLDLCCSACCGGTLSAEPVCVLIQGFSRLHFGVYASARGWHVFGQFCGQTGTRQPELEILT